jgi:hypothetical protein
MKLRKITLACMLVITSSAQAQISLLCDISTPANFVNTCAPAVTFFVAGSAAIGDAIPSVITANPTTGALGYFDTSSVPLVEIIDTGSVNGVSVPNPSNANKAGNGVRAWYGMSLPELTNGESVPLLLVFNGYMGSAAGVSNVMADAKLLTTASVPEAMVVTVGPTIIKSKNKYFGFPNTCRAVTSTIRPLGETVSSKYITASTSKVACSSFALTRADLAISDVDISELGGMYNVIKGGETKLAYVSKGFERVPLAMQGFAIAVNNNLYNALQSSQVAAGALPNNCTSGVYTEACQPSITRAQYASLVTKEGSIKSAAGLVPGATANLTLVRRNNFAGAGTQAASDMFFASAICNKLDIKSKINNRGGALNLIRYDAMDFYGPKLDVIEAVQTSELETLLSSSSGYSIGVIPLNKGDALKYKFVKLDGASPNFVKGGTAPLTGGALRTNMINGTWPLQMTSFAVYNKLSVTSPKATKSELILQMISDLGDGRLHDLPAIGYFNGPPDKQTQVSRVDANNCSPLINRLNQ